MAINLDAHSHIGPVKFNIYNDFDFQYCDPDYLKDLMEKYDIDGAVVFANPWTDFFDIESSNKLLLEPSGEMNYPYEEENEFVLDISERYDRFFPALMVSYHGEYSNQNHIKKLVSDNNEIYGLKVHTLGSHQYINNIESGFLELAEENNLPFIVHLKKYHTDNELPSFGNPKDLVNLAKSYPKINFVGAHVASFSKKFLEMTNELDNLYYDFSPSNFLIASSDWRSYDSVDIPNDAVEMIKKISEQYSDGAVWGSDFAWSREANIDPRKEYEDYSILDQETKEIIRKNTNNVFSKVIKSLKKK